MCGRVGVCHLFCLPTFIFRLMPPSPYYRKAGKQKLIYIFIFARLCLPTRCLLALAPTKAVDSASAVNCLKLHEIIYTLLDPWLKAVVGHCLYGYRCLFLCLCLCRHRRRLLTACSALECPLNQGAYACYLWCVKCVVYFGHFTEKSASIPNCFLCHLNHIYYHFGCIDFIKSFSQKLYSNYKLPTFQFF